MQAKQDSENDRDLLTVADAATQKNVSRSALYGAIREGRLPFLRIYGQILIDRTALDAWQPIRYKGRPGVKVKGGRKCGHEVSPETRARIAESQRLRWALKKSESDIIEIKDPNE